MSTPEINVSLRPCDSGCQTQRPGSKCHDHCQGAPVPIPCHIQRSVTFAVRLGGCTCGHDAWVERGNISYQHDGSCTGKPVHVDCSISGKTWAESEVADACLTRSNDAGGISEEHGPVALRIARARWALVKALVMGMYPTCGNDDVPEALVSQRDAVYAALAEMARAERSAHSAFLALPMEVRKSAILAKAMGHVATDPTEARLPSVTILEHWVERLIDQVGALP